jgi:hypothetical protein
MVEPPQFTESIAANPKSLSLPNPEISAFPATQPASQTESISAFYIYKNALKIVNLNFYPEFLIKNLNLDR